MDDLFDILIESGGKEALIMTVQHSFLFSVSRFTKLQSLENTEETAVTSQNRPIFCM